ncbi:c-type cytochrome [Rhodoferax sediminis]|jgi:cbb3-type cytochrome c oxidase subunit III|uniref:C-type cytochrome n=1 Tax=Rhodoferax sediminis TaxID=2509614 RepID=A0A515D7G7_9BURK|nr:cytochrome c [Rhodoferax sediminis]QDL36328.1 c-type cytochrome [Rhodoferax sediminis]
MTTPEILPQQERENPEPVEGANPTPWFIIVLVTALFIFGVVYILRTTLNTPSDWGDGRTAAELQGAPALAAGAAVDGAAVFASHCVACHQATGLGLPGVFPPLAGSDWVAGKEATLIAIVLHGINGPLTVEGKPYNGAMPTFQGQLQDAEVAAVLTHVRSQWGNTGAPITADAVAAVRKDTASRTEPFKGDAELGPLK